MIVTAFWLIRFPLSLQAYKPVLSDNLQSSPQELVPLDGIMQVKAGNGHTCTLSTTGGVKCWGNNGSGQLGDGSTTNRTLPVDVVGLGNGVAAISVGGFHTCALIVMSGVKCWGKNANGQLGDSTMTDSPIPVDVTGLDSNVTAIFAGGSHTCALTVSGGVKCWGYNDYGQLGDSTTTSKTTPVDVTGLSSGVAGISAGNSHTCAVTTAGSVKCWGMDSDGQLGDGGANWKKSTPVDVTGLNSGVSVVTAGGRHTCALTTAGGVKCWGYNGYGQLGDGSSSQMKSTPVDVTGLDSDVTAIYGGGGHTCALITGDVKCWGLNDYGQLGDGTTTNKSTPIDVIGLDNGLAAITTGNSHTCSLNTTGGVKCWGWNDTTNKSTPVDVMGLGSDMTAIAAGGWYTCGLSMTDGVKCWGWNDFGQLGDGSTTNRATPVNATGLSSGINIIDGGWAHTCVLSTTGGVRCWGRNRTGQVGDGTTTDKSIPVDVVGMGSDVIAIAVGGASYAGHTCVLTRTSGVKCWGYNELGQVGDGTTTKNKVTPVDVVGLGSDVTAISAGYLHTCALTTAGGVKCWGYNFYGQVGDGTTVNKLIPADVVGLDRNVIAIASGGFHTCALITTGGVKCWGGNPAGQLGNGDTENHSTPVDVEGLGSGVAAITAGYWHTCALGTGGGVKCWGWNGESQLGNGSSGVEGNKNTPVDVVGLGSDVVAIAAGDSHNCALNTAGSVKCWGSNRGGQLGNVIAWYTTPVDVLVQPTLSNHLFLPSVQR
jgi:alpha-tubulin suppressor-like RCC1 family protein